MDEDYAMVAGSIDDVAVFLYDIARAEWTQLLNMPSNFISVKTCATFVTEDGEIEVLITGSRYEPSYVSQLKTLEKN